MSCLINPRFEDPHWSSGPIFIDVDEVKSSKQQVDRLPVSAGYQDQPLGRQVSAARHERDSERRIAEA